MDDITGDSAERFVEEIAGIACVEDFVFANPKYMRAKQEKELCDLLIVIEKVLIVIQVKAAESLRQSNVIEADKIIRWNTKKQIEARKQTIGAKKALKKGFCNTVENARQGVVHLGHIEQYEMLGVTVVDRPSYKQNGLVHSGSDSILNLNFSEFKEMLTELSTVGDFVDYLQWRFACKDSVYLQDAGEMDVLAMYLGKREQADRAANGTKTIVEGDVWLTYRNSRLYRVHKNYQRSSYLVDEVIDRCHQTKDIADLVREEDEGRDGRDLPQADYIRICERLQRFRRHERQSLGSRMIEKDRLAIETERPRHFSEILMRDGAPVIVFLAHGGSRVERLGRLGILMTCCAVEYPDREVLGIVSSLSNQQGTSLDYGYIENLKACNLTDEQLDDFKELRKELFKSPVAYKGNEFDHANEVIERERNVKYSGTKADQLRKRGFKKRKPRKKHNR